MSWTDERRAQVLDLWAKGHSATQIAKKLGGTTRNAVIGVAHRAGLTRPSASKPAQRTVTAPVTRPRPMRLGPAFEPTCKPPSLPEGPPDDAGRHACTLIDLGAHQCRWPLGEMLAAPHLFCGAPLAEDRDQNKPPYCERHQARAFQPATAKKASPAAELARSLRRYI